MKKCGGKIIFGDDYGDNECTFHCELEQGHDSPHKESGTVNEKDYTLTWEV